MNYIWNDYSENKRFSLATENVVPGVEVWNQRSETVSVNVLVRFFEVLFPRGLIKNEEDYESLLDKYVSQEKYRDIFNLIIHIMALFDLNSGIQINDILIKCIENMIINKEFGKSITDDYYDISNNAKYMLLNSYAEYIKSENRNNQFYSFLESYYKQVNIYYQKSRNLNYVYIHMERSHENEAILRLAEFFLADMNYNTEVMWKGEHIPIIGFDYTMIIDNICV